MVINKGSCGHLVFVATNSKCAVENWSFGHSKNWAALIISLHDFNVGNFWLKSTLATNHRPRCFSISKLRDRSVQVNHRKGLFKYDFFPAVSRVCARHNIDDKFRRRVHLVCVHITSTFLINMIESRCKLALYPHPSLRINCLVGIWGGTRKFGATLRAVEIEGLVFFDKSELICQFYRELNLGTNKNLWKSYAEVKTCRSWSYLTLKCRRSLWHWRFFYWLWIVPKGNRVWPLKQFGAIPGRLKDRVSLERRLW